ncbi:MAG: hypothetical protein LBP59_19320 [Planctomycetaceae bacterium]|jgi:hypothetical protein|nr:hypothetical protein [Planctomycetaceae bacterium]
MQKNISPVRAIAVRRYFACALTGLALVDNHYRKALPYANACRPDGAKRDAIFLIKENKCATKIVA